MSEQAALGARPAATIMLVRERHERIELFMLRRSSRSAFVPGMFVFPGGAVDAPDVELARMRLLRTAEPPAPDREPSDPSFEVAALREAFEEAGILLAAEPSGKVPRIDPERIRAARARLLEGTTSFGETLDALGLVLDARNVWHFSHWVTPPEEPRRFDTHFYLAAAPDEQHGSADEIETHQGLWIEPAEALLRRKAGTLPMIFPTVMHLRRLAQHSTLEALREFATTKPIRVVHPKLGESRRFGLPGDLEDRW